jgi:hypothetical protein
MLIKRQGALDKAGRFGLSGDGAASALAVDFGFTSEQEIVGRAVLRVAGSRIRPVSSR